MKPRLGVIAYAPIQYHTPLYQLLAKRNNVELDILFLSDRGLSPSIDPGFGLLVSWDLDMTTGYAHQFLATAGRSTSLAKRVWRLAHWLPYHDAVVVNGYSSPWMLLTMAICRIRRIPYILRASSHPQGPSAGFRRCLRRVLTRIVVSGSTGALALGKLNEEFYRVNHARSVTFAPNSVEDQRFASSPRISRSALVAQCGLEDNKPLIIFSGKLIPRKRPLDLVAAVGCLPNDVNVLFVGDGPLAERVRTSLNPDSGAVTGFVNQSHLPSYYHAADILVLPSEFDTWGLVVNEAMAAGTLPIVSDRVGCAPDLVCDIGEVFRCGDVPDLAEAISRAIVRINDAGTRRRVRQHVEAYSLVRTAIGFERAAQLIIDGRRSE
jgi:glycosyltransferase involved in cell wall biosynthesis